MGTLRQFYGEDGAPLCLERDLGAPAMAWHSHRARLRSWVDSVPDREWSGPTRCALWDMTGLVRHLISGSQFLGYTLHKANAGTATILMQGFDTHRTVQADAARFGDLSPSSARDLLASKDVAVDVELGHAQRDRWSSMAEAPPGRVPAHLAVNHFLLDSWVHELDLMLPRGEQPVMDGAEAEVVVCYLVGLASLETGATTTLDVRLAGPDLRVGLAVVNSRVHVTIGSAPSGAAVIEGQVVDFVDRTTGRQSGPVSGDAAGLAVLDGFGSLLAS